MVDVLLLVLYCDLLVVNLVIRLDLLTVFSVCEEVYLLVLVAVFVLKEDLLAVDNVLEEV